MAAAGLASQAALADRAGLTPPEISRLLSATASRRPTALQRRKLAAALGVSQEVVARALGERDREQESHGELVEMVDQLTREASELRQEVVEKRASLEGAEQALRKLTYDAGALHAERDQLRTDLETATQQRVSLEARLRESNEGRLRIEGALAEATRRLGEIEALLRDAREQAASDMARLLGEISGLRLHMDGNRFKALSQSILGGPFGNRVRALLEGEPEESVTAKWARRGREARRQAQATAGEAEAEPIGTAGGTVKKTEGRGALRGTGDRLTVLALVDRVVAALGSS